MNDMGEARMRFSVLGASVRRDDRLVPLEISFEEWHLIKSLAEEVRDETLSRSRQQDAFRAVRILDQAIEAVEARARSRLSRDTPQPTENWLEPYIEAALASKLCVEVTCGMCGSTPFKSGLVALASGGRQQDMSDVDQATLREIGAALAQLQPPLHDADKLEAFERAAMTVIYFLWSRARLFERQIEPTLAETWAGEVLGRMRDHYAGRANRIGSAFARLADTRTAALERRRQKRFVASA